VTDLSFCLQASRPGPVVSIRSVQLNGPFGYVIILGGSQTVSTRGKT
jgi:hypothetical protein